MFKLATAAAAYYYSSAIMRFSTTLLIFSADLTFLRPLPYSLTSSSSSPPYNTISPFSICFYNSSPHCTTPIPLPKTFPFPKPFSSSTFYDYNFICYIILYMITTLFRGVPGGSDFDDMLYGMRWLRDFDCAGF